MLIQWLDIPGYEGIYKVSNTGEVFSVSRLDSKGVPRGGHTMKTSKDHNGYLTVGLRGKEKIKRRKVHQLVLEAFVGERPIGYYGCHADGNKLNNHLGNLRWDTPAANQKDKINHGRSTSGEANPSAKLTAEQVLAIKRRALSGESCSKIAQDFDVTDCCVRDIKKGRAWKGLSC